MPPAPVFLKLGGSLITDKATPQTARPAVLARLANEIAVAVSAAPHQPLLIGHGSGSFGHVEARKYNTRAGVHTPAEWHGFAQVADVAGRLNRLVVDALRAARLPIINISPSAVVTATDGQITHMATEPIQQALAHGLIVVVHGDVAFDTVRGGTIVSTEEVFNYLANQLHPQRILLAGIEPGVLTKFPGGQLIPTITAANIEKLRPGLRGSAATDVTGGMESKVLTMLAQVQAQPGLSIRIFSGETPGYVTAALLNDPHLPGTTLR